MKFAKLYNVVQPGGDSIQVLYQRLSQKLADKDGNEKYWYMLVSTIENGDNVTVATHPLESLELLNQAFDLINQERAEALIKELYPQPTH